MRPEATSMRPLATSVHGLGRFNHCGNTTVVNHPGINP